MIDVIVAATYSFQKKKIIKNIIKVSRLILGGKVD